MVVHSIEQSRHVKESEQRHSSIVSSSQNVRHNLEDCCLGRMSCTESQIGALVAMYAIMHVVDEISNKLIEFTIRSAFPV